MLESIALVGAQSFLPLITAARGRRVVIILSGGLDSYTLLNHLRVSGAASIRAVIVDYDQRHACEMDKAADAAVALGIPYRIMPVELGGAIGRSSALFEGDVAVPHGHYHEETMRQTVVPGRNTILLALALSEAQASGADLVVYGAHGGDHFIYPDCRPEFVEAMATTMLAASEGKVSLLAPYLHLTKAQIVQLGLRLGLDYAKTWTCYEGGEKPCLRCGSCQERIEAFAINGVPDPLLTADAWIEGVKYWQGQKNPPHPTESGETTVAPDGNTP